MDAYTVAGEIIETHGNTKVKLDFASSSNFKILISFFSIS